MSRTFARKNVDWETPKDPHFNWDHVAIEVLMDIRSELKELNRTISCYRMQRMSDDIHRIDKRLLKHGLKLR